MQGMYSMRSPAVKRLMKEAQELSEPTEQYACQPLEDNLFEWHFTIRGPADSEFDGGLYHGRIILPPEYPMKPPSIILLTHNGRFEVNKKICLSISGHHPESWQPSWSLRTALLAIIGFMPTHGAGALGSLDYTPEERKRLAKRSQEFVCPTCGPIKNVLKEVTEASEKTTEEARELAAQISFKDEKEKNAALRSAPPEEPLSSPDQTDSGPSSPTDHSQQPPQQPVPPVFPPPLFGQFPFPAMPPFPIRPQEQQGMTGGVSQVPRFPLPFIGPMMPPYPPFMPQGFPVPPGMPGVGVPPWQMSATPPPVSTRSTSPPASARDTSEASPGAGTGVQSNPARETKSSSDNPVNAPASESSEGTTPAVENPSDRSDTHQTGTSSVRQRHVTTPPEAEAPPPQPASSPRVFQSAQINTRHTQSESPAFLVFATVIIAIISFLVLRRLYMMNYFGFANLR